MNIHITKLIDLNILNILNIRISNIITVQESLNIKTAPKGSLSKS